jgi:hypothetical protein
MINEYIVDILNEENPQVKEEEMQSKRKPKTNFWKKEEVEILLEQKNKGKSNREIADILNKKITDVITKYDCISKKDNYVIPERNINEVKDYIKNNLHKTDMELAQELKRSKQAIGNLRRSLGIKRINAYVDGNRKKYTPEEIDLIKSNLSVKEISEKLGRSQACIYMKRKNLGIVDTKKGKGKNVNVSNLILNLKNLYEEKEYYNLKEIENAFEYSKRN